MTDQFKDLHLADNFVLRLQLQNLPMLPKTKRYIFFICIIVTIYTLIYMFIHTETL